MKAMRKIAVLGASVVLSALFGTSGPVLAPAAAGEGGAEKDVCVYSAHGSSAERTQHAKANAGQGGGKTDTCSKTYARWTKSTISVFLDTGNGPSSIPPATYSDYAAKAFQEWSCHSGLGETTLFSTASSFAAADITLNWGDLGTTGILGQTGTNYFRGVISHSAITMNSNNAAFAWTAGPAPNVDADGCAVQVANGNTTTANYDFLSVLTHEIGHSLGVSHPNRACNTSDQCYPETMFSCTDAEEYMRRALNPGDILSVSSLYGSP